MLESLTFLLSYGTAGRKEGPPPASREKPRPPLLLDHRKQRARGSPWAHMHTVSPLGCSPLAGGSPRLHGEPSTCCLRKHLLKEPLSLRPATQKGWPKEGSLLTGAGKGHYTCQKEGLKLPLCFSLSPGARDPLSKDVSEDATPDKGSCLS